MNSICWNCVHATGAAAPIPQPDGTLKVFRCPWVSEYKPVPGWTAKKNLLRESSVEDIISYRVSECPYFAEDLGAKIKKMSYKQIAQQLGMHVSVGRDNKIAIRHIYYSFIKKYTQYLKDNNIEIKCGGQTKELIQNQKEIQAKMKLEIAIDQLECLKSVLEQDRLEKEAAQMQQDNSDEFTCESCLIEPPADSSDDYKLSPLLQSQIDHIKNEILSYEAVIDSMKKMKIKKEKRAAYEEMMKGRAERKAAKMASLKEDQSNIPEDTQNASSDASEHHRDISDINSPHCGGTQPETDPEPSAPESGEAAAE